MKRKQTHQTDVSCTNTNIDQENSSSIFRKDSPQPSGIKDVQPLNNVSQPTMTVQESTTRNVYFAFAYSRNLIEKVSHVSLSPESTVLDFENCILDLYQDNPSNIIDMQSFSNRVEYIRKRPLDPLDSITGLGLSPTAPLLVKVKLDMICVWFALVNQKGQALCLDNMSLEANSQIMDLRYKLKQVYSDIHLKGIDPANLKIFKDNASYNRDSPLDDYFQMVKIVTKKEAPLVVLIDVAMDIKIWFRLVRTVGNPFKNAHIDYIILPCDANVQDLKLAVIKIYSPSYLINTSLISLTLFEEKESFEKRENFLDDQVILTNLKNSKQSPMYMMVSEVNVEWTDEGSITYQNDTNMRPGQFFSLPENYLKDMGLLDKDTCMVYCRSTVIDQFNFLKQSVLRDNVLGWILGPPGTGKSITSLAFISTLDTNVWTVTWISLSRNAYTMCIRFENQRKKVLKMNSSQLIPQMTEVLRQVNESRKHIVILDGFTWNGENHNQTRQKCYEWLYTSRDNKRLVIVCSMSGLSNRDFNQELRLNVSEFYVYSWKLQEYYDALTDEPFFQSVKDKLDVGSVEKTEKSELIDSKFYYAGGCSRFMFDYKTRQVSKRLNESIRAVPDILTYIEGRIGDFSSNVINRLFSLYIDRFKREQTSIVSEYAATRLAIEMGPSFIIRLENVTKTSKNPSMNGWIMEMWVFASIYHSKLELYDKNNVSSEWSAPYIGIVELDEWPPLPDDIGIWLKPFKWNQGGFDAIYIEKAQGLVRFVQITRGKSHHLKLEYLAEFLENLLTFNESFVINTLEVIFVVDYEKLLEFDISNITGLGSLFKFDRKWVRTKEHLLVQVLGVKRNV